jgi:hypothetical protein
MTSAAPRLAEGAENSAIVADRELDRQAERRFAQEASELIANEPVARRSVSSRVAAPMFSSMSDSSSFRFDKIGQDRQALINAIILSQALGNPHYKK